MMHSLVEKLYDVRKLYGLYGPQYDRTTIKYRVQELLDEVIQALEEHSLNDIRKNGT
jgi:hypothetical protein